jgi:hypothetical protein
MGVQTAGVPAESVAIPELAGGAGWSLAARVGFRFCVLYFGLYCLATQILGGLVALPVDFDIPDLSVPLRPIIFWAAAHIFKAKLPLVFQGSGSGDKTFDWVLSFCLIVISAIATAVWSLLDRKRANYARLAKWFRIFLRFALAGQMMTYGFVKAVPLQMPFPHLTRLVESYGSFSPMGVLWASIGASPSYEMFVGIVEIVSGALLIIPATTMLGAMVCLMDSVEIFTLNMTYDVPVKLFAFHLILLSLFLLAPDFKRLFDFFLLNRPVQPSMTIPTFKTRRASRIALAVQLVFGLWLLGNDAYGARKAWLQYGGGSAKSPLYGIWDIDEMAIDGQIRSPLLTDYGRWRRAIFDFPQGMTFQRMDGSSAGYGTDFKTAGKIALTKYDDKKWKGNLSFGRKTPDQLTLDGEMGGHKIHMQLKLVATQKFQLVSRGFHWIQEYPFNR